MAAHTVSASGLSGIIRRDVTCELECRVRALAEAGPAAIDERLAELDRVWTAGRAAKAALGVAVVAGLGLGLAVNPWFFLLPIAGGGILIEYVFSRQSVLGAMFRGMGLPSGADVEREKLTLKALRGDFKHLPTVHQLVPADDIARLEGEGGIVYESDEPRFSANDAVKELLGATRPH